MCHILWCRCFPIISSTLHHTSPSPYLKISESVALPMPMPKPKHAGNSQTSNSGCAPTISYVDVSIPSSTMGSARVCRASPLQRERPSPRPPAHPRTRGSLPRSWPLRGGHPRDPCLGIRDRPPPSITRRRSSRRRRTRRRPKTTMPSVPSFRRS